MESDTPSRYDIMSYLGDYYAHGEFGVIFTDKGWGDRLVKIVNLDAENDENLVNASQLQFFQTAIEIGEFKGIPKIYYALEFEVNEEIKNHITHTILKADSYEALQVLGLETGDTIGVWIMDKLESIGVNENLSLKENALLVSECAKDIWDIYQIYVTDLQSANYGQLPNGEFVIFDPIPSVDVPYQLYLMENEDIVKWFYENQVWVNGQPASKLQ